MKRFAEILLRRPPHPALRYRWFFLALAASAVIEAVTGAPLLFPVEVLLQLRILVSFASLLALVVKNVCLLVKRVRLRRGLDQTRRFPRRAARLAISSLTELAALVAGPDRPALSDEWHAHLAGESGHDPVTWRKIKQALGFVAAAIQLRLADAADLAWRPADAVLGSRTLSNLFVGGPVIVMLVAIVHHDGRFGLVADDQDPVALGAFLYVVIKTGRWWRGVKPPEPKPRRAKE